MVRTKFHNLKAFKKTLKKFGNDELIKSGVRPYSKASKRIQNNAKRSAPVGKTGKLRDSIRRTRTINRKSSRGSVLNYYVYSNSIQDMVLTYGIPNRTLSPREATERSRTYKGSKHRLRAGFNYTRKKQLTKKGNVSKRQPIGKDGRPWAFGFRRANPFMTKGQNFNEIMNDAAQEIGDNIFQQFDKMFSGFAK